MLSRPDAAKGGCQRSLRSSDFFVVPRALPKVARFAEILIDLMRGCKLFHYGFEQGEQGA